MDQFLDLLDLPTAALRERIEQELSQNPVLLEKTFRVSIGTIDVFVNRVNRSDAGEYDLRLSDHGLSGLCISQSCLDMYQDPGADLATKCYLEQKINQARRLLEKLEERQKILQRVGEAIFQQQRAFLEHGPSHLVPLSVEQVAGEIGFEVLTVLRAVQGKQVRTPHGVFPLGLFMCDRPDN